MKMLSEMSAKQAGLRVRTGLQGGRDVITGEECYRYYDAVYFDTNKDYLKKARDECCTKYFENSGCLRNINTKAEDFFS